MESLNVILIMIAVLQPVAIGLVGWLLVTVNQLNREVGVMLEKIENIIRQGEIDSKVTDRRLDEKENKKDD